MIKGYSGIFRLGEATSTWDADSPVCWFLWNWLLPILAFLTVFILNKQLQYILGVQNGDSVLIIMNFSYLGYSAWTLGTHQGWGHEENCCIILWRNMASATNVLCHQSKFDSSVLDVLNLWGVHVVKIFHNWHLKLVLLFWRNPWLMIWLFICYSPYGRLEGRRCMRKQGEEKVLNFHQGAFQFSSLMWSEA